jgi:sirohydrochlorin ferrochelatase
MSELPGSQPASTNGCPAHNSREIRFKVNANGVDELARAQSVAPGSGGAGGTAVLLVSHGSHSPSWRHMLLDVHREVADELLGLPGVSQVRTAFMEYTEPSIATQLRALDAAGVENVLVIPLLLTISDHSFDDIPVICGAREDAEIAANLAEEGIEIYAPAATLEFAPLLDFSDLVETNLARRIEQAVGDAEALRAAEQSHGLVLVGYGSADFDDEWHKFFDAIDRYAEDQLGVDSSVHAWCGHLVEYSRQPTIDAIEAQLEQHDRVIVVPIFVAYDEMFHEKIIGRAAERCSAPERVIYTNDSVLPDPEVGRWVIEIASSMLKAQAVTT